MIGLSPNSARLYAQIASLNASRGLPIDEREIRRWSAMYNYKIARRLRQLESRKFIKIDRTGRIIAIEPPHQIVMRETCMRTGLSEADILSTSHIFELVRARRIIAKRLRYEFNYAVRQIAILLNRHPDSVADYFGRERAQRRSKARAVALYGERIAA
jgi:hypothetical protein